MSSIAKRIVKNKKVNNLSKYLKETYDNGFHAGVKEAILSVASNLRQVKNIEGVDDETFKRIVKHFDMEELM